mgnify:FL=1
MLLKAKKLYNIDMKNSWLIGDNENDILSANSSGISNTILVRSGHKIKETITNAAFVIDSINNVSEVITG